MLCVWLHIPSFDKCSAKKFLRREKCVFLLDWISIRLKEWVGKLRDIYMRSIVYWSEHSSRWETSTRLTCERKLKGINNNIDWWWKYRNAWISVIINWIRFHPPTLTSDTYMTRGIWFIKVNKVCFWTTSQNCFDDPWLSKTQSPIAQWIKLDIQEWKSEVPCHRMPSQYAFFH